MAGEGTEAVPCTILTTVMRPLPVIERATAPATAPPPGSWVGLLLDAHDVATAATAAAQAALKAAATGSGSSSGGSGSSSGAAAGLLSDAWRAQALSVEMLRQLSSSRRFWTAVLQSPRAALPEHAPSHVAPAAAASPVPGGAAVAAASGAAATAMATGDACLAARLLLGLSYHLSGCAPYPAVEGAGSSSSPGSNAALLPALVPLLAQPELWGRHRLSRLGGGGSSAHVAVGQHGQQTQRQSATAAAAASAAGGGQGLLQPARELAMRRLLAALVQCFCAVQWKPPLRHEGGIYNGRDGTIGSSSSTRVGSSSSSSSSSEPAPVQQAHTAGMRLLPVLAAALMPDAVPYGHKPKTAWAAPDVGEGAGSSLWDQVRGELLWEVWILIAAEPRTTRILGCGLWKASSRAVLCLCSGCVGT
mgnify:CR=1 FL=1